ncbi:Nudix hydrolase 8 [Rhynchospora pubera]|uniref:Nudix hydrolase 8 n=1 Tax=Rhynchospora pubera TaxID=906938 RepID=A0AAV8G8U2_9POAL|nr:Nudix hydrolase 8 [Rhynchospora pubera]KAJ4811655.1 Nudix hydrolase 8 [Rhynchospora pubera]
MERLSLELRSQAGILEERRLRKTRTHAKCFTSFNCSLFSQWEAKASYQIATPSSGNVDSSNFLRLEPSKINGSNSAMPNWNIARSNYNSVLDSFEDEYGGIVINADRLPQDPNTFACALPVSLSYWKRIGKKGVWLKLPLELSDLVPVAVKKGFKYHHAEEAYVMLTYWLPEGPCLLPANASHQVGVGGFVLNDQNQVLVVQEKYCDSAFSGAWKLPTGFIQESEEIFSGAVREVQEETGIDTEFVEVIAFRHAHHLAFEKSDLFFICMLRPLSQEIKIDETEIQAAKWMPFSEFVEQPLIQDDSMFKKIMEICIQRLRKNYCGLTAHPVISKFDGRWSSLYYNVGTNSQDSNCHVS